MPVHVTVLESEGKKNLENAGGEALMESLEGKGAGLPFQAFVSPDGRMIINSKYKKQSGDAGQNIGHPWEASEILWFLRMVVEAAPQITREEIATLMNWLAAQKK